MLIIALLAVFFLVSCVLAYFSAKTWHWLHVTAALLTFLAGSMSLIVTANYLEKEKEVRIRFQQLEEQLAQAIEQGRTLKTGDPAKDVQDEPTVTELEGRFNRLISYQRGRVWRACELKQAQGNQFQLQVIKDTDDAAHGITSGHTLFAFLEQLPLDRDGDGNGDPVDLDGDGQANEMILLPGGYVGEFLVTASDAKTVTIKPSLVLDTLQQDLSKKQASWVLYEMMPVDGHVMFASSDDDGRTEYVQPNDEVDQDIFGEMNEDELRKVFSDAVKVTFPKMAPPQQQVYVNELLKPYTSDGHRLTVDEDRQQPDEVKWYKVVFLTPHSIEVDATTSIQGTRSYFDTQGLAVDPRLMRKSKEGQKSTVTFKKDDIGIFMKGSEDVDEGGSEIIDNDLDDWIEKGICRLITPIYVRQLNSYQEDFQMLADRGQQVDESIRLVEKNIELWRQSKQYCDRQIVYRRDEKAKLDGEGLPDARIGELPGFQRDVAELDKLLTALQGQRQTYIDKLSRIYRTNMALREQLALVQKKLKEQIDAQSRAAVAQNSGG